jgi:hypothetical protein
VEIPIVATKHIGIARLGTSRFGETGNIGYMIV